MIEVEAEDEAWTRMVPDWEALCMAAAELALNPPPSGEGDPAQQGGGGIPEAAADEALPLRHGAYPHRATSPDGGGLGGVTVLLTDDETVRDLNDRFRQKNTATNVLSFPAHETATGHLGDIALAYGVCAREAVEQNKPLAAHLQHLVAHGVLHLVGYDHEDEADAEIMEDLERQILARLGLPDPYVAQPLR